MENNSWPRVVAQVEADGRARVNIGGAIHDASSTTVDGARATIIHQVSQAASQLGRSLHAWMVDPDGEWPVIVHPDGNVEPDLDARPAPLPEPSGPVPDAQSELEPVPDAEPYFVDPVLDDLAAESSPLVQVPAREEAAVREAVPAPVDTRPAAPASGLPTRREVREAERRSFITTNDPQVPASSGWRGVLTRVGVRMGPTDAERAERENERAVSQHWPGVRTVTVVNGKGGSGKTPTTILLAAAFARWSGSGVLAWDANQTRGTLGWRTEQGPHDGTVLDLLPQVDRLLGVGALSGDMAQFVHHQGRDRFDVLRSQPLALAADQRVSPSAFDRVWSVCARFYPLLVIDTGNDESDELWLRVVDHTDQLVVPTNTRGDSAEAGALLLDALRSRDDHGRELADNAIVVVSQADPKAKASDVEAIVRGFEQMGVRGVATVPYDPAMVDGHLEWSALSPKTRSAWLSAAAAVARGL